MLLFTQGNPNSLPQMEEFPASHTTATVPVGEPEKKLYVNSAYLKTKYGKLKIAHLVSYIHIHAHARA